jgi:hypothetical protein
MAQDLNERPGRIAAGAGAKLQGFLRRLDAWFHPDQIADRLPQRGIEIDEKIHNADYDGKSDSIAVVEMPTPRPGPGEVLVRVFASPINPSDLMFIQGLYGFQKPLPAIPGFEGSGTVVQAGTGITRCECMFRSGRTRAAQAQSSGSDGFISLAAYIFDNSILEFRKRR